VQGDEPKTKQDVGGPGSASGEPAKTAAVVASADSLVGTCTTRNKLLVTHTAAIVE